MEAEFDQYIKHVSLTKLCHELISTAILPLPLIKEEHFQLAVKGALSTGNLPQGGLPSSLVRIADHLDTTIAVPHRHAR